MIEIENFYLNAVAYLLYGRTQEVDNLVMSIGSDKFYLAREYVVNKYNLSCKSLPLFRGILIDDNSCIKNGKLKPLEFISAISFSEDKSVAEYFADTKSDMSQYVMQVRPNSKGYLIEHTPSENEILFHYSWAEKLNLYGLFPFLEKDIVDEQKEVILFQFNINFDLKEV